MIPRARISQGHQKPKIDLTTWDDKMLYALVVTLEYLSTKKPSEYITKMLEDIKVELERREQ